LCLFLFRSIYIFLSLLTRFWFYFFYINLPFNPSTLLLRWRNRAKFILPLRERESWLLNSLVLGNAWWGLQANSWLWLHILDHKLVKTRQLQCRTIFADVFQNWRHREVFKIWTLYSRCYPAFLDLSRDCMLFYCNFSLFLSFPRATYRFCNLQQVCAISFLRIVTTWFLKNFYYTIIEVRTYSVDFLYVILMGRNIAEMFGK